MLYLGALGDRYGRTMMLLLGMVPSVPACLLAAFAWSDIVLFIARVIRGAVGGHGLSDDAGIDRGVVVFPKKNQAQQLLATYHDEDVAQYEHRTLTPA